MHAVDWVTYRLQNRWKLVEDLTRENHARSTYRQAGNPQSLGRPCVTGMTEIVCSRGSIEDALRIGTGADAARGPFLVHRQIIPKKF